MLAALDFGGFRGINAGAPASGTDLITRDWWQAPDVPITGPITINGPLTTDNTTADEVGFKGIPQTVQGTYTFALTDAGKSVSPNAPGLTFIVPANATVAFPSGTVVTVFNNSGGNLTISPSGGVDLYLAGTTLVGSRTLSNRGLATIMKLATNIWVISGAGIS